MSDIQLLKQKGWEVLSAGNFLEFPLIESVNQGFVYALEYGDYIKIGKTQNLVERMRLLIAQAKNYSVMKTGLVAYTQAHTNFSANEKLLHATFNDKRVENGELFVMNLEYFAEFLPQLFFENKLSDKNEDTLIKITKSFSKNLHRIRKQLGLTQSVLASKIEVSRSIVRRWECGIQMPRVKDMPKLCNVLNCTEADLLGHTEVKNENNTNQFFLILNGDGRVGINFTVNISSRSMINDVLAKIRSELEFGFDSQVRRGIIQEA